VFKTAGSLLLVCTDELLAELGGEEVAAALAGEPTGEAVLSVHVATDGEVDAAVEEAVRAGGVVVKGAAPTPAGRVLCVLRRPRRAVWEVIHHPLVLDPKFVQGEQCTTGALLAPAGWGSSPPHQVPTLQLTGLQHSRSTPARQQLCALRKGGADGCRGAAGRAGATPRPFSLGGCGTCQSSRWKVRTPLGCVSEAGSTRISPSTPLYLPEPPVTATAYGVGSPRRISAWPVICPPRNA
jgi:hypothetical protein